MKTSSTFLLAMLLISFGAQAKLQLLDTPLIDRVINVMVVNNEAEFSVDIPNDSYSFLLQIEATTVHKYYFSDVKNPLDATLVGKLRPEVILPPEKNDLLHFLRLSNIPQLIADQGIENSLLIPNTKNVELFPGKWTFRLQAVPAVREAGPHQIRIRTIVKTGSSKVTADVVGVLPINLHLNGSGNLTAANFENDPRFLMFWKSLKNYLATARIIPLINHVQDSTFPRSLDMNSSAALDIPGLIQKVEVQDVGLNLFFTSIKGSSTVGISSGSPGLITSKTSHGGVIASFPSQVLMDGGLPENLLRSFQKTALTTSHEIGHYLGLLHVCEKFDKSLVDGLSDTECDPDPDYGNLMMPDIHNRTTFSEEQKQVMLRNPHVDLYRQID